MASLFAGTSGFAYPSWKPAFYPEKLAQAKFLSYYATRLNAVEVNYTFRQLPSESTLLGWVAQTPESFVFAPKAHMKITHVLRLRGAEEFTRIFLERLAPLRDAGRLGPVLFQLPPNCKRNDEVLGEFVRLLPKTGRAVFEFRHESWFDPAVYALLREHNTALCRAESERLVTPDVPTADFVYFRLRKSHYSPEARAEMAVQASEHLSAGRDVYVMFKHEDDPAGALYAEELRASQAKA